MEIIECECGKQVKIKSNRRLALELLCRINGWSCSHIVPRPVLESFRKNVDKVLRKTYRFDDEEVLHLGLIVASRRHDQI